MTNTIWNQWYHQNRYLKKSYPFVDNIPKPEITNKNKKDNRKKSKLEKKV